jgi:cellulose synthase/poly-beta-1,6-N-acetylglucosamine synthase-like glycosyltransferase
MTFFTFHNSINLTHKIYFEKCQKYAIIMAIMETWKDIVFLALLFISLYYEMFLLITYLERRHVMHWRVRRDMQVHDELPSVTIIVPCFNEEKTVIGTINSLLSLKYPEDKLSIFVVNDGSTDNTLEKLQTFKDHHQIKIFTKENGGKHSVLNFGISLATSELVGCLDADSFVKEDALLRIAKKFDDPNIMAVVPTLHIHEPTTIIQKIQKVEYLIGVFITSVLGEINSLYVTPGPFSIFRKSVFDKIGLYKKAHNTEDMEMALRMQVNGLRIACAHDAVVYTSSPKTVKKLYKQRVRWTSGFLANVIDYRKIMFSGDHGQVGYLVLPFMIILTGSVLFIVGTLLYDLIKNIVFKIQDILALGTKSFEWSWPHLNWFFTHTSPIMIAGIGALCMVLTFIIVGSKLANGNKPKFMDIVYYMSLYSFIAPWWVVRSVANVITNKQTVWR